MTNRKGTPLALKGHKRTLRRNLPNIGDSIAYQKEGVTVTACNDNNVVVIAHLHLSSPDDLVTCERQIGREKRTITQPKSVYQVKLVNHDITRGKKQLHPLEVEHTRKVAFIGCVRGCSISGLTGIFNMKSW